MTLLCNRPRFPLVLGLACVVTACGIDPVAPPATSGTDQSITGEWIIEPFNNYKANPLGKPPNQALDGQFGWSRINGDDMSPEVFALQPESNGYRHGNAVGLRRQINPCTTCNTRSTASKDVIADTTARFQIFSFQVKVDPDVPATNDVKAAVILVDDKHAGIVKVNIGGLGFSLCGSSYDDPDCVPFFPNGVGDNGAAFQRIWYRIVIYLDQYAYNPTAYAEINVVGDAHLITRTNEVTIDSDPVDSVALYDYGRQANGIAFVDYLLGYPKQ